MSKPAIVKGGVVSKDTLPEDYLHKQRRRTIAKGIVLIACMAVLVLVIWSRHNDQLAKQQRETDAANAKIHNTVLSGDYDKAIHEAKSSASTDQQTQMLLISAYLNKGDYKSALDAYGVAIQRYGASLGLLEGAASAAEQAQEYQKAIDYYQQAKEFIEKGKDYATKQADMAGYDDKIRELTAKI